MKKYKIALIFFQLLASTIILMTDANAGNFEVNKTKDDAVEEKDLELENTREKDAFPDLLSFATQLY